jgi:hypothetical protein
MSTPPKASEIPDSKKLPIIAITEEMIQSLLPETLLDLMILEHFSTEETIQSLLPETLLDLMILEHFSKTKEQLNHKQIAGMMNIDPVQLSQSLAGKRTIAITEWIRLQKALQSDLFTRWFSLQTK